MSDVTPAETSSTEFETILAAADGATAALAASSASARAAWLEAVAEALDAAGPQLLPVASAETHLLDGRLAGELARTTFQLRLFGEILREGSFLGATIDHADPNWPMGARPDLRRMLRPIGPVAVYAASNFPFAFSVAGGDTAAALAAGAPVVVKANPGHPRLSRLTAEIVTGALAGAGAPAGAFALVDGFDVGTQLVLDPRITAAAFTGSLHGGRALFDLAVRRPVPIPFYGELGSTNPAFVTPAADAARADAIAAEFLASMSLGVGQFCTKPGFLFVPAHSSLPATLSRLAADVAPAPMLNDSIAAGYGRVLEALESHPAISVLGASGSDAAGIPVTLLQTTAQQLVANSDDLLVECFGPTAVVVTYADESDLLAAVAAFSGQLTAAVHGESSDDLGSTLVEQLVPLVGRVLWNGWPTGVSVTYAQQHGGPYPATTSVGFTSVGTTSIERFLRPIAYQGVPQDVLPLELRDANPLRIPQRVDGILTLP